ncbi:hypothetical protein Emtol_2863 [Emticicia oligotrophica DSM 17448]|uniref:Uncharacterized protein n=1 Tax=Emticicia oligotrophica (strain DSM 17448 / CIP 109782 / MTCC 6937 / GPTSA100-15) TaxID=929562 RepID=A0ABN4AP34_EMTOG|nr:MULTISPECIES: hypothetical protein [Emticicia]AFK03996.1 hypothetical protein Emtol_2863 [Emticicia oligotrophica DSM 17448]
MKNFELKETTIAHAHVLKHKHKNPTKPTDLFYQAYAVACQFDNIKDHFSNLDISELAKPENSIGIRVYIGENDNGNKVNYLTFIQLSEDGFFWDDVRGGSVYLVNKPFMNLKKLRKPKPTQKNSNLPTIVNNDGQEVIILTSHQSCEPDCPKFSLLVEI